MVWAWLKFFDLITHYPRTNEFTQFGTKFPPFDTMCTQMNFTSTTQTA